MAARRHGVRIDTLKDEPLLVALPESHHFAGEGAMPVGAFAAERVLLPSEPPGRMFNSWLRTLYPRSRVRARADDRDAQRPVGSADVADRERRSGERVVAEWVRGRFRELRRCRSIRR